MRGRRFGWLRERALAQFRESSEARTVAEAAETDPVNGTPFWPVLASRMGRRERGRTRVYSLSMSSISSCCEWISSLV